jgi:uncharacterized protein YndB with AHSA1/START domain
MSTTSVSTHKLNDNGKQELVLQRVFDAPRELVFNAWTDPEQVVKWWGPKGWTTTNTRMEVRPGGLWHFCMRSDADGMEAWSKLVYREIVPPERLVSVVSFSDAEGNAAPGMPELEVTVEFAEQDGRTHMTYRTLFESEEQLRELTAMGMVVGFRESWEKLDAVLGQTAWV